MKHLFYAFSAPSKKEIYSTEVLFLIFLKIEQFLAVF